MPKKCSSSPFRGQGAEGEGRWAPGNPQVALQGFSLGTRSAEPGQGGACREPSSGEGEAQNACLVGP